jgi:hypothetical protein
MVYLYQMYYISFPYLQTGVPHLTTLPILRRVAND